MSLSEIDLEFIASNVTHKKQLMNPDRALVRYEFMEVLCRIGILIYFKSKSLSEFINIGKQVKTKSDAIS